MCCATTTKSISKEVSLMSNFNVGWIPELEAEHYRNIITYQDEVGQQLVYEFSQVKDKIYEESKRPINKHIDEITKLNFQDGNSSVEKLKYFLQIGSCCCAHGVGRSIADRQQAMTYKGKEIKGFDVYIPWLYSQYHLRIVGKPSSGGCSVSGMMDLINRFGILPDDLHDLPSYKEAITTWNSNRTVGNAAFEKYKNVAEKFQVITARLGRNEDDIIACCKAGYSIAFGTSIRCSLQNGYWSTSGTWMHAMSMANSKGDDIYLTNSHGEGKPGLVTKDTLKKLINGRYFDAFVILDIERERKTDPNWSLL